VKSGGRIFLAAMVSMILMVAAHAFAAPAVGDPDDTRSGLDIAKVRGTFYNKPSGSQWAAHRLTTYEPFSNRDLRYVEGSRYGSVSFSLDVDHNAIADHYVIVDFRRGALRAELLDDDSERISIRATRPNRRTVQVKFPRSLLGSTRGYYWSGSTTFAGDVAACRFDSGGCYDFGPDSGSWVWLGRGQNPRD
jgi:hypothetical protein